MCCKDRYISLLRNYNFLILTTMQGGIISTALELVKEKEKQADKASARLHDGMKTQMELTANQGSWTGDQSSKSKPAAPTTTVVVQKDSEDDKEEKDTTKDSKEEETPASAAPGAPSAESEDDDKKNIADMGIISLAQGASK
jgi:hypothetical protein